MMDESITPDVAVAAPPKRASRALPFTLIVLGAIVFLIAQISFVRANAGIDQLAFVSTATVDMAGYQRTLTQRILAEALLIQTQDRGGKAVISAHAELVAAEHIFDATLAAFTSGGSTENSAGASVAVDALTTPGETQILADLASRWKSLRPTIDALGDFAPSHAAVDDLAKAVLTAAPQLSVLENDLSEEVEKTTARDIAARAVVRNELIAFGVFGLLLVVAGFFLRVTQGQRQIQRFAVDLQSRNEDLARSSASLLEAKAQEDLIMQTVRQGLFLIDTTYAIGDEYSKELETIFRATGSLRGMRMPDLIARLVPPKILEVTQEYLALLFDKTKRERAVLDVNPLDEIEVSFPDASGGFTSRYLSFSFRRIVAKKAIARVFVAVSDITDRVTLERRLRDSERRKERQFEMLLGILTVDSGLFEDFLETANEQVAAMSEILRAQQHAAGAAAFRTEQLRDKLDAIFRNVHNIKGNAALLGLDYFVRSAENIEAKITELRARLSLSPDDFIALIGLQAQLRDELAEAREVRDQLAAVAQPVRPGRVDRSVPPSPSGARPPAYAATAPRAERLASTLAAESGKRVRVEMVGMTASELDPQIARTLDAILPELVRYSVTRSIETPQQRRADGKSETGTIAFRRDANAPDDTFAFLYHDDGAGFDPQAIRDRAIARGLCNATTAERISDRAAFGLLFAPGFLRDESDPHAIAPDLAAVKRLVIDEMRGEMCVASNGGAFAGFTFRLPQRVVTYR